MDNKQYSHRELGEITTAMAVCSEFLGVMGNFRQIEGTPRTYARSEILEITPGLEPRGN